MIKWLASARPSFTLSSLVALGVASAGCGLPADDPALRAGAQPAGVEALVGRYRQVTSGQFPNEIAFRADGTFDTLTEKSTSTGTYTLSGHRLELRGRGTDGTESTTDMPVYVGPRWLVLNGLYPEGRFGGAHSGLLGTWTVDTRSETRRGGVVVKREDASGTIIFASGGRVTRVGAGDANSEQCTYVETGGDPPAVEVSCPAYAGFVSTLRLVDDQALTDTIWQRL